LHSSQCLDRSTLHRRCAARRLARSSSGPSWCKGMTWSTLNESGLRGAAAGSMGSRQSQHVGSSLRTCAETVSRVLPATGGPGRGWHSAPSGSRRIGRGAWLGRALLRRAPTPPGPPVCDPGPGTRRPVVPMLHYQWSGVKRARCRGSVLAPCAAGARGERLTRDGIELDPFDGRTAARTRRPLVLVLAHGSTVTRCRGPRRGLSRSCSRSCCQ
jgi:hypothetical protein